METPNDLVQIDIETALVLYTKGYTHIPVLQRDGLSTDWSSMQPLYLDDILDGLMCFASDSRRELILNPPKVDIGAIKESIYLDDDPDWVEPDEEPEAEPEPEPDNFEELPAPDEVRDVAEKPVRSTKELAEEMIAKIHEGKAEPMSWNVRDAICLHDKEGMSCSNLATLYGIKSPQTVINRINQYKMK